MHTKQICYRRVAYTQPLPHPRCTRCVERRFFVWTFLSWKWSFFNLIFHDFQSLDNMSICYTSNKPKTPNYIKAWFPIGTIFWKKYDKFEQLNGVKERSCVFLWSWNNFWEQGVHMVKAVCMKTSVASPEIKTWQTSTVKSK